MQINQYPITATIIKDEYLFDMDAEISVGVWQSQKVPWALINNSVALKVGTTKILSGTNNRVLYQAGGYVAQSANFTFDESLKRLELKASGVAATDIPLKIINSAATETASFGGNGLAIIGVNSSSSPTLIIDPSGSARATLRGGANQSILLNSSGWNNLNGGSGGWDIEATGGEIRQRNGSNYTLLSGNYFGIGRTPSARLDVQAQGALSTDIAFRVRNSGDTLNSVEYNGDGSKYWRAHSGDMHFMFDPANNRIHLKRTGIYSITTDNAVTELGLSCNAGNASLRGGSNMLNIVNGNNFHFEENSGTLATSGAGAIVMKNRTAPSTNVVDRFYMYSADIVAGNAAPHFRTENGSIIKLYKETTAVDSATLVSGGGGTNIKTDDTFDGFTIQQIVKALRNIGILA